MNDSLETIRQSVVDTQGDFTEGVKKINEAYYQCQLEKATLKSKEVK